MRIFLLTCLAMIAFASNSILNRMGVGSGAISAEAFALIRLFSGVGLLGIMVWFQGAEWRQPVPRWLLGGASLTIYMFGFSLAYRSLDAGIGALILFGVVQFTMFAWNVATGSGVSKFQLGGGVLALGGLALVLWPTGEAILSWGGVGFMVLAGVGWGAYSLVGRGVASPLGATAGNFVLSLALTIFGLLVLWPDTEWIGSPQASGIVLAVLSGAVTSGLGYAVWYMVLPSLSAPFAATVQLSVPVLALVAGALGLGEVLNLRIAAGSAIVLCGIAMVLRGGNSRMQR